MPPKRSEIDPIDSFSGHWGFLSNFHPVEVVFEGVHYPTVEHAFQAAKSTSPLTRRMIRDAHTPSAAKTLGRNCTLRSDWEEVKLGIMEQLLRDKFAPGSEMASNLIGTGTAPLVEGNWWGDTYWGVCRGKGENHLGRLLMKIRDELKG